MTLLLLSARDESKVPCSVMFDIGSKLGAQLVVRFGDGWSRSNFMVCSKLEKFWKGNKYLRERAMEVESPKSMSTLDPWKKWARMEYVPVQSVNKYRGFESVRVQ